MTKLTFLGATGTVTGSKFLLEHDGFRLLVDCGLFHGLKELRLRNRKPLPVSPEALDLVVLTHAHLDHSGWLPVLVRDGYRGRVLATAGTCDLCGILLPDSGHLQEEDARFAAKHGFSRHRPPLPLYTEMDARRSLGSLVPIPFDEEIRVHRSVTLRMHGAGHILGAAHVEVVLEGTPRRVILFSGDVGRPQQPLLPSPTPPPAADHLLIDSTYGNRDHTEEDPGERLAEIVRQTVERGGSVIVPAFAVGRTQTLLYLLRELRRSGRLARDIPIHVDSPMAIHAIRILMAHRETRGDDPLGLADVHLNASVEESKALNHLAYPAIIISASGMATGGRVLHHLAHRLPDHRHTVLFAGFQAAGTRGRAMQDGAREVKIHGRMIPVRARVETLEGLSAHADRGEIEAWLRSAASPPRRVHLVHGEPAALDALSARLEASGFSTHVPHYLEELEIG